MTLRAVLMRWARVSIVLLPLLLALAHAAGVWRLRWVDQLDAQISDTRLRLAMPGIRDERIVIVDIDEPSLARIGRWPWSRERLAALTDELFERQRAAVVGFDLVFAEAQRSDALRELQALAGADPALAALAARLPALAARLPALAAALDQDARFAQALAGRRAVLGYYFTSDRNARRSGTLPAPVFDAAALAGRPIAFTRWDGYGANLDALAAAAPRAGFFNMRLDGDAVVRSVPLVAEFEQRHYEALALAMYRAWLGEPRVEPRLPQGRWQPANYNGLDSIELVQGSWRDAVPVDALGAVTVPYRGPGGADGGSFAYVSAADLLEGRVPAGRLADKLVLVGTTAPGLFDLRATPVAQAYPGVEVHASLLSGLLDGRVPVRPDWALGFEVAMLLATAALLGLLLPRQRALAAAASLLTGVALQLGFNLWLFTQHRLLLPLASVLLLTALVYAATMSWGYLIEGRTRRSLARLFGTYVPPELVREMAQHAAHNPAQYDMRAENRELSVMFCDMRNFTRVAESLSPQDVRELVNRFFSAMTLVIRAQRGTLDKYIGDAIMAFWGAPLADPAHAQNAVQAALAMTAALAPLNRHLHERGLPEVGLGIGINSGLVCVGDMGSDLRRSYTVMGDPVNLASRIEALTRHYGVDILVGEATRAACDLQAAAWAGVALHWLEVDRVRVKGKSAGVTLFTPVPAAVAASPSFGDESRLWQLARDACQLQHWDEAIGAVRRLEQQHPASPYSALYRQFGQRLAHHKSCPPARDWDGIHDFDSK